MNNDTQDFHALYVCHYNSLLQFAMTFLHSKAASEDVVSDIFLHLWQNPHLLTTIPNMRSYLYRAVRNQCINVLGSAYVARRGELSETAVRQPMTDDNPLDNLTCNELREAIRQAIATLPGRCRLIFKMARTEGLKHRKIAEILGIKLSTVERQLILAKNHIRKALRSYL